MSPTRSRTSASWRDHVAPTTSIAQGATAAFRTFVVEVAHPVEVGAAQEAHLLQWLGKRLGRPLAAPDLSRFGYKLMGGRLLPAGSAAAAQLMYDDASGRRLTVYVRAASGTETAFRFQKEGEAATFAWIDQGFGFAVTATATRDELLPIAEAVYLSDRVAVMSGGQITYIEAIEATDRATKFERQLEATQAALDTLRGESEAADARIRELEITADAERKRADAAETKAATLNDDVTQAVKQHKFHLYIVKTVDEALTLLTGVDAGEKSSRGLYPKKSVNGRALHRQQRFDTRQYGVRAFKKGIQSRVHDFSSGSFTVSWAGAEFRQSVSTPDAYS